MATLLQGSPVAASAGGLSGSSRAEEQAHLCCLQVHGAHEEVVDALLAQVARPAAVGKEATPLPRRMQAHSGGGSSADGAWQQELWQKNCRAAQSSAFPLT